MSVIVYSVEHSCKNRLPYNLYCVGEVVKHCSLTNAETVANVI